MQLANLFVNLEARGFAAFKGLVNGVKGTVQSLASAGGPASVLFGTPAAASSDKRIQQITDTIKKAAQPFRGLSRALSLLPGEMQAGLGTALDTAKRATARGLEGQFQQLAKLNIDRVARARGLGAGGRAWLETLVGGSTAIGKFQYSIDRLQKGLGGVFSTAGRGFAILTAGTLGWVTAGLAGTVQGQAFAWQMRQLSLEIAGIFLPTFDKVFGALRRLTGWFRSLSGDQQNQTRQWIEFASAVLGVVVIEGKILGFFSSVAAGMQGLIALGIELNVVTGGILLAVGALVTAFGAWAAGTDDGRKSVGELVKALGPVADALGRAFGDAVRTVLPTLRDLFRQLADIAIRLTPLLADQLKSLAMIAATNLSFLLDQFDRLAAVAQAWLNILDKILGRLNNIAGTDFSAMDFLNPFGLGKKVADWVLGNKAPGAAPVGAPRGGDHRTPTPTSGGFEDIAASFNRVQVAALRSDPSVRTANATEEILTLLKNKLADLQGPANAAGLGQLPGALQAVLGAAQGIFLQIVQ